MSSAEYDLEYLRAGLELLQDYLLAGDIYWPIGTKPPHGDPPYPRLTLGGMLLAQKRAEARQDLDIAQRSELVRLDGQLEKLHNQWRVAWEHKAAREFHARLNLWQNYLNDYRDNPNNNADRYAYEVSRRLQLQLLKQDAGRIPPEELELLDRLDRLLEAVLVPGDFVWEPELASGFPPDPYWYLWGNPRGG